MNKDFINVKQELPESINILAAMRHKYSQAKCIRISRLSITLLFPIISAISIKFFPEIELVLAFCSSVWLILNQIIFQKIEKNIIEYAAKLQENLDVSLFKISWNEVLVGDRPHNEDILMLCQKFKGNKGDLKEWYQGLNALDHFSNVLLAQRMNIIWDKNLRKFYSNILTCGFVLYLLLLFTSSFFLNISFQTFTFSLLVPSLSLILHLFEVSNSHKQRYQSLERIASRITEQELKQISYLSEEDITKKCRQYQDYIYLKRCDSNTIPDKIYWIKRNTYDKLAKMANENFSDSM